MLARFNDRIFLQDGRWFLWDSMLDLFRPIDGYAWNGTRYDLDDRAYRTDPMSKTYCFGTVEMLAHCVELTKKYKHKTVHSVSFLTIGDPVWFRDRPVSFTPCATKDIASWKRLVNGRARTCRQRSNKRFTKRNLK